MSPGLQPAKQYFASVTSAITFQFIACGTADISFCIPGANRSMSSSVMPICCFIICRMGSSKTSSTPSLLVLVLLPKGHG